MPSYNCIIVKATNVFEDSELELGKFCRHTVWGRRGDCAASEAVQTWCCTTIKKKFGFCDDFNLDVEVQVYKENPLSLKEGDFVGRYMEVGVNEFIFYYPSRVEQAAGHYEHIACEIIPHLKHTASP